MVLEGEGSGRGILSWQWRDLPSGWSGDLDGLTTTTAAADPETPVPASPLHPNGALAVDHVVVLSPDVDRTVAALAGAGLRPRRERRVPGQGSGSSPGTRRQVFFRVGQAILELVGPDEPDPESQAGPAVFFGVAVTVTDLDLACRELGDSCGPAHDAVQTGRRIATLRHRARGMSVPIAFMSATTA